MGIKLTRIYTRTGDSGETALVGGERVRKTTTRVEAYGTADELNSVVGILRTLVEQHAHPESSFVTNSRAALQKLQNRLFDLGSLLAASDATHAGMPQISAADITWLEQEIDRMNENLPSLNSFVLPGGGMVNAYAHLARTVCRRLERSMWRLQEEAANVPEPALVYVNRLSDYLFVYARWAAQQNGESEYLWEHPLKS
ncbi:MAG: cob(I)yrinic acid a,c-diamide adenosyltransferase [Gammaproteobacteria bacterium]